MFVERAFLGLDHRFVADRILARKPRWLQSPFDRGKRLRIQPVIHPQCVKEKSSRVDPSAVVEMRKPWVPESG